MLLLAADPVFTLGSDLRGLARVAWTPAGLSAVDATLLLGPGAVQMLESDEDLLRIRGAELVLDSPAVGALDARLRLDVEQDSRLDLRATVPDLNAPEALMVDARADLNLPKLGAFNRLVPELDRMAGRLEAGMNIRGPLAAPVFDGQVAILDGAFLYAPLGTRIEALELVLDADRDGGRLLGSFRAGEGAARIEGQVGRGADGALAGTAAIRGESVQLFDVDWMELTISPNLDLGFTPEQLRFGGALTIDRARIGMPPGAEQRVAVSEDVVVLDGGEPPPPPPPSRPIEGELELRLGDDVRLAAAGMETRLTGALDIEWAPGKPQPVARGRIRMVDGSYRAFGQNLEVSEGDVLFTGNPIDNPVLAVEAVRTIFGDPQVEQAGVRIAGPAQNPEITLFTSPPTSREKALAYILTGANFDHAAGQGAFSVGFWVLPQLFVSYGLGLFDSGNVLAARYELSRRWGVRATSGERDTGVDISFMIDR
jgi:translocation and assembly module TamB